MELGMFTSGYQYYPLERAFADARRFGYDYIELWGGRPHAFAPDLARGELSGVLALIERHEMPVRVYTPEHNAYPYNYMLGSELQRADALDYLKLCLNMGKALGADHTLISTGHGGYTASRRELRDRRITPSPSATPFCWRPSPPMRPMSAPLPGSCPRRWRWWILPLLWVCAMWCPPGSSGSPSRTIWISWAGGWPTSIWRTAMGTATAI